jgi:hypothetical protein
MNLFGDRSGPHLVHFHARREPGCALLEWELRGAPVIRWRVLRSSHQFAVTADALPGSEQTVIMEGTDTHATDETIEGATPYFYSVFAQDEQGTWHLQVKVKLRQHGHSLEWHHGEPGAEQAPSPSDVRALYLVSHPPPAPPHR